MTAALLKQTEIWWKAIVSSLDRRPHTLTQPQLNVVARNIILGIICLHLSEQRGILAAGQLCTLKSKKSIYARFCQLLQAIQCRLPIPSDWLTPLDELEDTAFRVILTSLDDISDSAFTPVEVLGQVYEKFLEEPIASTSTRKSGGVYYTPKAIAEYIVERTVGALLERQFSIRVLDPACGGGIFLLTAYQHLLNKQVGQDRSQLLNQIHGVDIDPQAVAVTKLSLLLKLLEDSPDLVERSLLDLSTNIQCGNAVIGSDFKGFSGKSDRPFDWYTAFPWVMRSGGFDAVIGNPPYLDAEGMTTCLPGWRSYCSQHYRTASGNWDLFCIFIEKALELCKPGGLTSLIVPNKLASADYAAQARSLLASENQLLSVRDYSQIGVFAAAVYPLVYVAQKGLPRTGAKVCYEEMALDLAEHHLQVSTSSWLAYDHFPPNGRTWMLSTHPKQLSLMTRLRQDFLTLGAVAQVHGAATVGEAYALQPLIQESQTLEPGDLRLVNSGTIDRYKIRWGEKRLRYLGATYLHPMIPQHLTIHLPKSRYQQAYQPKLLVAGLAKQLECTVDLTGSILAGKSTSVIRGAITPQGELLRIDLRYLLGLLNSRLVNLYISHCFSSNRLQGGYLQVGPPQLKQLPIPDLQGSDLGDRLVSFVDQMLRLQQKQTATPLMERQPLLSQIHALDRQIDRLVYELYRLTDAEITAVNSESHHL